MIHEDDYRLLNAVEKLTKPRRVPITLTDDDSEASAIVVPDHPPLLVMLFEGTGITRGARSSEIRIPIDADALELYSQIEDLVRLWCKQLKVAYDRDDLCGSLNRWFLAHSNGVRAGKVSEGVDLDVTIMVEGWARMIENKFDPPEKREWKEACVAEVTYWDDDGIQQDRICGARKVLIDGAEQFAIQLNVTDLTAECRKCGRKWVGKKELMELRFQTNVDVERRAGNKIDDTAKHLFESSQKSATSSFERAKVSEVQHNSEL